MSCVIDDVVPDSQGLNALPFIYQVKRLHFDHLPATVQIWQVELVPGLGQHLEDHGQLQLLLNLLDADEQARCLRYHRLAERIRFAVMRITLRRLLAESLSVGFEDIHLGFGPFGKPFLAQPMTNVHFNLSHSRHIGLIALSSRHAIGIDVEAISQQHNHHVMPQVLSAEEQSECANSNDPAVFFQFWTGKEAILKALGTGIQQSLSHLSLRPKDYLSFAVSLHHQPSDIQAWQLPVTKGYAAALALVPDRLTT